MKREAFLNNIAARLGRKPGQVPSSREIVGVSEDYKENPFGAAPAGQMSLAERFKAEFESNGGRCMLAASVTDASAHLREVLDELEPKNIVTWDKSEFSDWRIDWLWSNRGATEFSAKEDTEEERATLRDIVRTADVGVTTASFAAANTATLTLISNGNCNRSVSLLPTVHIVILRESQVNPSIGISLESLNKSATPSSVHYISGPSRSSDIENDLTIGVHGPVAVIVIVTLGI
jgi:L-lactate dehydrogenase complex protein LldG